MNDDIRDCCDWPPAMLEVFHRCPHRAIRSDLKSLRYVHGALEVTWLFATLLAIGVYIPPSVKRIRQAPR